LTLVLSSRADVALTGLAALFAGRALTSHFGVAQPMRGPVGLGAAGWRRSADHDRRSVRELAPVRGGASLVSCGSEKHDRNKLIDSAESHIAQQVADYGAAPWQR
jgi:hypothetical protein